MLSTEAFRLKSNHKLQCDINTLFTLSTLIYHFIRSIKRLKLFCETHVLIVENQPFLHVHLNWIEHGNPSFVIKLTNKKFVNVLYTYFSTNANIYCNDIIIHLNRIVQSNQHVRFQHLQINLPDCWRHYENYDL